MKSALHLCRNKSKGLAVQRRMSPVSGQHTMKASTTADRRPTDTSTCSISGGSSPTCMPNVQHLCRDGGNTVAYRQTNGNTPGVLFLPGFMSNMNGGKAVALERFCTKAGLAYMRFDYQGCGASKGSLKPGIDAFDVWRWDALAVLDQLTSGPQILVGSSMGGALMLLLALERPKRIQALIGLATAVNFTKQLNDSDLSKKQVTSDGTNITPKDFINKKYWRCLKYDSLAVHCPIRLLHGMQDETVPFMTSLDVAQRVESKDVDVILRKSGDHRLSQEGDIRLLTKTLESLIV
ncbi:mycophenolic acid acyl-glucuronide esterase, mitochondrial-like [Asterias rubens]|uniref:mycophenolic acid acyl-glucuronide esterase, mitochondrial-like n=1 Tax=Asterias rubens TaxID=7604 RepID=UPI0014554A2D|nr:mycophenolic acid acyl-glucuronide esterase, mitochondrial-like [Asterias rubens]